ncbi:MAG: HAD-IA family hydrolase [Bacteroidales bacterium]|nr:HAD-IA family hydrolase [Bacteroidales bacterium]
MIRLIILDFDGTLGDTRANIVMTMNQTLAKMGYPVAGEEEVAATIGVPLEEGFRLLLPGISDEEADECAVTYRDIFEINRKKLVPRLFPQVRETLAKLWERGYVLTVASSRLSASLNGFLKDMEIDGYISYVLGADNVAKAKPDPEPVLKTMSELGFSPGETLVVGDMPVDIIMGRSAGALTCGVTYGNSCREDLLLSGAGSVIDSFSDLLEIAGIAAN